MLLDQKWPNGARHTLASAAIVEVATGVMLIIDPAIIISLLFGADAFGSAPLIGRMCGIGLFALGIACWPDKQRTRTITPAFKAMLTYNVLIALYLIYLGTATRIQGLLLWPAVALHTIVGLVLIWIGLQGNHSEA